MEKLGIKVLPCLVIFGAKANVKDRIVGFEDLGNSDGFTTKTLEWRLAQGGEVDQKHSVGLNANETVIFPLSGALTLASTDNQRPILGFPDLASSRKADDDDDLDWD